MRVRMIPIALAVASLLWNSPAMAQQGHIVDPSALRQAVADQAATDRQNRDAVLSVLHGSEARELAGQLGLSLTRAESAVSTLDSAELANLADSARTADAQLAGGANNTIVISTTTLLLVLIIVILLVR